MLTFAKVPVLAEAMQAFVSFVLCALLFAVIAFFAYDGESVFQWHPIFFGFGLLMCTITAINVMQSTQGTPAKMPRKAKGQLHGILQIIGIVCMVSESVLVTDEWGAVAENCCYTLIA